MGNDDELAKLKIALKAIEENESTLGQGLLRVDELRQLVSTATIEYELASDRNSIQFRKFDKARRQHPRFTPHRRSGYAEPEDGAALGDIKQAIVELLHTHGVKVEPREVFIRPDQPFIGRVEIRNILSRAEVSIDIKDDYLFSASPKTKNIELLEILTPYLDGNSGLSVRLLGSSDGLPKPVLSDVSAFLRQHPHVSIKGYSRSGDGKRETHDRFVVIDGKDVFITGASAKDLGMAQSIIAQVKDGNVTKQHIAMFEEWWGKAQLYTGL